MPVCQRLKGSKEILNNPRETRLDIVMLCSKLLRRLPGLQGQLQDGLHMRSLYSPAWYPLEDKQQSLKKAQEDRPDYAEFMEKYKTQFRETGIKRLLRRDIQQFSKLMATPEDLKVQTEVFLAAVKDSRWRSIQTRSLVDLGHDLTTMDQLELAKSLWDDPAFLDWAVLNLKDVYLLPMHYVNLLYKHEEYDTVIDFVSNLHQRLGHSLDALPGGCILVLLGSLAKTKSLTPQEALEKARQILCLENRDHTRASLLRAWLAYRAGEVSLADDILSQMKSGRVKSRNLLVKILSETGHVSHAIALVNGSLDSIAKERRTDANVYSIEVMKAIVKAVSESGDPLTQKSLSDLCERMDREAEMTDDTIEDMVFQPIEKDFSRPKKKGPFSAQFEEESLA